MRVKPQRSAATARVVTDGLRESQRGFRRCSFRCAAVADRNWRFVDLSGATERERMLINDLAREFGNGLINA